MNRNYTTQSGEKREETCFLTVVVWGKQAETCSEYLDKGSPIMVEGRLQTRDWETKDGQKRNRRRGRRGARPVHGTAEDRGRADGLGGRRGAQRGR